MAAAKGSRFGVLSVEDDDSGNEGTRPRSQKGPAQQGKGSQMSGKKTKKPAVDEQAKELQKLAFGKPVSAKAKKQSKKPASETEPNADEQWRQWQNYDAEATKSFYEKDLEQALLASKIEALQLETERKAEQERLQRSSDGTANPDKADRAKKSAKATKPLPMSLAAFNRAVDSEAGKQDQPVDERGGGDTSEFTAQGPSRVMREPPGLEGTDFFKQISEKADSIVRKEQIQDEYSKQYTVHNAMVGNYMTTIEQRDKEIAMLKKDIEALQGELQQVKKRSQQLCSILATAEMKEKAQLVEQLQQTQREKDELSEQVAILTETLEKERSAAHSRKPDAEKRKGKSAKP